MPTQEYLCGSDGPFDIHLTFAEDVENSLPCPTCGVDSIHVLRTPAGIFVKNGTGARRGNAQPRKESAWNEKASDQQRDPYTQAKAQLTNLRRAEGGGPITEEAVQVAAKQIDAGPKKGPSIVQQQFDIQKKLRKEGK